MKHYAVGLILIGAVCSSSAETIVNIPIEALKNLCFDEHQAAYSIGSVITRQDRFLTCAYSYDVKPKENGGGLMPRVPAGWVVGHLDSDETAKPVVSE